MNLQIPPSAPFLRFLQQHKTNKSTPAMLTFSGIKIESERHFKPLRLRFLCNFPWFSVILPQKRPKRRKKRTFAGRQKFVLFWLRKWNLNLMTYRTGRIVVAHRFRKTAALPTLCFVVSHGVKTIINRFYLFADYSPSGRKATTDS